MSDHIFGYWDDPIGKPIEPQHNASGKSLADRDGLEFHSLNEEEEKNLIEFLESDDYQDWQLEIMEREKIETSKMSETKDKQFYAVVDIRKVEIVSPSESQLMSYYRDYGYTNIDDVIEDYGEDEMIREWYNNTNWTEEFNTHREKNRIYWIDSDREYEEVTTIPKEEWERLWKINHGF